MIGRRAGSALSRFIRLEPGSCATTAPSARRGSAAVMFARLSQSRERAPRLNRAELLSLPAATDLTTLGRAFGISPPVARERHRLGEWERLGIRVLRLGAQWRVVTADIWRVLGVEPGDNGAGPLPGPAAAAEPPPLPSRIEARP